MRTKSLLLTIATTLVASTAWADVEINETNFPDENLRTYLLDQDWGSDFTITDAELATITAINVSSKRITDMTGIEHFTALKELNCSGNWNLTALDVTKLTALEVLNCSGCKLSALDVAPLTALRDLNCSSNSAIETLDLSKLTKLTKLNCSSLGLTAIDLSANTQIDTLYCNSLSKITALDLTKLTNLKYLAYNYGTVAPDLSQNTQLVY